MTKYADDIAEFAMWAIIGTAGAIILYHGGIWAVLAWLLATVHMSDQSKNRRQSRNA